ncbi:thioredoxin family protein [Spirochaeta isovalerica]|uniref:Thiol-disulfide isomerase/thioredoxin n=1 Tax=Spirochaeta isovalerica TaxID=150 RepID=A0A841RC18_9SPIO|nr:thioredoxin family protein [Spirochaeta isovalerica]MBB6480550.1 thiol-disulfide isomerase/thioredoxin [Spirochaeta isovalerica]
MNSFHEFDNLEDVKEFIKSGRMRLVYLSRPACGVCSAIKIKVLEIIGKYPELEGTYVNMDIIPESAGEFSIFTIPGIILYIDGKESIREARYVSIEQLEAQIDRFYHMIFD